MIAAMNPEAEAWRIAAFVAIDKAEAEIFEAVRCELDFNPVAQPERLQSTGPDNGARDVKNCHDRLMPSSERSRATLERPLAELETVAESSGLPSYVRDFRAVLRSIESTFSER